MTVTVGHDSAKTRQNLTAGGQTVSYYSIDLVGNAEATQTATVRIDGNAPVTTDDAPIACAYADFPNHFGFFLPLAGITTVKQIRESTFDIRATSRLNKLYVELLKDNPDWASAERRPDMNHFMARLIFCFFAEDTDIFHGEGLFTKTVEQISARYPRADSACSTSCARMPKKCRSSAGSNSPTIRLSDVRISRAPALYRQFCALNALLFSTASHGEKEAALIAFMGDQDFCVHPTLEAEPALGASMLSGLVERIEAADPARLSLDLLARESELGRYQLIRAFRAATGLTPHAYLLNARVNRGRQLLNQGQALAEVAYQLGFADQSHFQRVFKAHVGVTPGQYRGTQ